jgi:DNA-binding transcriptional LysR family regulator
VAVVEQRSFTGAADRLRLSKAAVSKQIARLESSLGARLLNRTTRQLSLTDVGQVFYQRARAIVSNAEDAVEAVNRLQGEARGLLRVNAPMSFGTLHVAPLMAEFARMHPGITLEVDFDDRYVDLVDEGYDAAIRIGQLTDSRLVARRLVPARRLLLASPAYLEKHGMPRTIADLAEHSCLTYSLQRGGDAWPFQMPDGQIRHVPVSGRLRANNSPALRAAVRADLGITLLPIFAVHDDLVSGKVREIVLDGIPTPVIVHAVYPHNRLLSIKVRLLIDFLVSALGAEIGWR